tara:strand:+ start:511 stop:1428 length:918 start_codon:yes stop_codon:yes gene_type:complete
MAHEEMCEELGIPVKNPYSFDDILHCKDITDQRVIDNYKTLVDFDALTNPKKMAGNPIIYRYQFKNLLNCRRGDKKDYKILEEWFTDPELKEQIWREAVKRNRVDKKPYPCPTDVYECHRLNKGAIVAFKSTTAKYIYKKYNATSVLDPTAGWGGRLLGATSLGIKYVGYDTNTEMKQGYEDMVDILKLENSEMRWRSSQDDDFSDIEYDMILTSPPYFNMEIYEHMDSWSNEAEWYSNWLIPLLGNAWMGLAEGGHMCINIDTKMYTKLLKYGHLPCDEQIDLRQQMGKQFMTKPKAYVYVWKN